MVSQQHHTATYIYTVFIQLHVQHWLSGHTLVQVEAICDIPKGTELLVSYGDDSFWEQAKEMDDTANQSQGNPCNHAPNQHAGAFFHLDS
jgi:hypothetical protein